jgi:hypothetical protein
MSNTDRTKKPEVKPGARDNIPALLLIQSSPVKVLLRIKDPLPGEIWTFRNGQPDRDDNCIFFYFNLVILMPLCLYTITNTSG